MVIRQAGEPSKSYEVTLRLPPPPPPPPLPRGREIRKPSGLAPISYNQGIHPPQGEHSVLEGHETQECLAGV